MSHEMIRREAEAAGYDTDGLPVTATVAGRARDFDVVDVWELLSDADDHEARLLEPDELTVGDA